MKYSYNYDVDMCMISHGLSLLYKLTVWYDCTEEIAYINATLYCCFVSHSK